MPAFQIQSQPQPGLFLLDCPCSSDDRGEFVKIFHCKFFEENGISFIPAEIFMSRSNAGVLRGMHFQDEEAAHDKLVYCLSGSALDVVVDIRPNSPYFNRPYAIELSPQNKRALFISKGFAHGFFSLEDNCCMIYQVSTVHSPSNDRGILWSSIDFEWPTQVPIISRRDSLHPPISDML